MQARDICGRKATLEVMTKRQANRSTKPLRCILNSLFHSIKVDSSKMGSHGFILRVMAVHRSFMGMNRTILNMGLMIKHNLPKIVNTVILKTMGVINMIHIWRQSVFVVKVRWIPSIV